MSELELQEAEGSEGCVWRDSLATPGMWTLRTPAPVCVGWTRKTPVLSHFTDLLVGGTEFCKPASFPSLSPPYKDDASTFPGDHLKPKIPTCTPSATVEQWPSPRWICFDRCQPRARLPGEERAGVGTGPSPALSACPRRCVWWVGGGAILSFLRKLSVTRGSGKGFGILRSEAGAEQPSHVRCGHQIVSSSGILGSCCG